MVAIIFISRFHIDEANFKDLNIVSFSPCGNPKRKDWNQKNRRIEKTNKRRGKGKYRRGKLLHTLSIQKGKMIA